MCALHFPWFWSFPSLFNTRLIFSTHHRTPENKVGHKRNRDSSIGPSDGPEQPHGSPLISDGEESLSVSLHPSKLNKKGARYPYTSAAKQTNGPRDNVRNRKSPTPACSGAEPQPALQPQVPSSPIQRQNLERLKRLYIIARDRRFYQIWSRQFVTAKTDIQLNSNLDAPSE